MLYRFRPYLELVNFKNISANHVIVSEMGKRQTSCMAGVYYVAAELSTLGYTALVTTRNARLLTSLLSMAKQE